MTTPTVDLEKTLRKIDDVIEKCNKNQKWLTENCIFMHLGGSWLYGTNTPESDIDVRGVVIPPKDYWIGALEFDHFEYQDDEIDISLWDIRKFIRNIARVSPNVVETLFADFSKNSSVNLQLDLPWIDLRNEIAALINGSAFMAFYGYSQAQLKKMVIKHGNKTGRREIVDSFGFDLKFAAHGFRLARQGKELLETGNITFPRPDALELLDIRYGRKYGPNDMNQCIKDLEREQEMLRECKETSVLPEKASFEDHNNLLMQIYDNYVGKKE